MNIEYNYGKRNGVVATKAEEKLRVILQNRITNMVEEVLSQFMVSYDDNDQEHIGAFDSYWEKTVIVAEVELNRIVDTNEDNINQLAEDIRIYLIDDIMDIDYFEHFAIETIDVEVGNTLKVTYILSSEWNSCFEMTETEFDDAVSYITEQEKSERGEDCRFDKITLRKCPLEINVEL